MLPYWFSAMTMKSVGKAALAMVEEVRRQFNTIPGLMEGTARPDYKRCVQISTQSSLAEMLPPGALVMISPIAMGALFGTQALAGMLAGALVSGVQLAVSMSNTGGAWDNAKKYIEVRVDWRSFFSVRYPLSEQMPTPFSFRPQAGNSTHARELGGKGSDCHKAAVVGDTVGDPLKDTSGPSLNILVKLMAVESLVSVCHMTACEAGSCMTRLDSPAGVRALLLQHQRRAGARVPVLQQCIKVVCSHLCRSDEVANVWIFISLFDLSRRMRGCHRFPHPTSASRIVLAALSGSKTGIDPSLPSIIAPTDDIDTQAFHNGALLIDKPLQW